MKVKELVEKAVRDWAADRANTDEEIIHYVYGILDDQLKRIVLTALGFRESFGSMELVNPHQNPVAGQIREAAQRAAAAWLMDNEPKVPQITKKMGDSLSKHYMASFSSYALDRIRNMAQDDAENVIDRLVRQLLPDAGLGEFVVETDDDDDDPLWK